nr:NAD(+) kinase [Gammaproteobacteria bacterium]
MVRVFQRIGIIVKRGDERVAGTLDRLVAYLQARSIDIAIEAESAPPRAATDISRVPRDTLGRTSQLVMVIGGDGTFLSAARSLVDYDVPLLGINVARLGFLTDLNPLELSEPLDAILAGNFQEERRFLLKTRIARGSTHAFQATALNDVVVHKSNIARLIEFETYIDTHLVYRQRSDGLIVSTPTGSTAYALAGGGPILRPSLDAIVLVPICPHTLSNRPLVVDMNSRIEVILNPNDQAEGHLTCDGQTAVALLPGDRVIIEKKRRRIRMIHPPGYDYFATLRSKLGWNSEGQPRC